MSVVPALLALQDGPGYVRAYVEPAFDASVAVIRGLHLPPPALQALDSFLALTPFHCLLAAVLLTYSCHIVRVLATFCGSGGYDNADGRGYTKKFLERNTLLSRIAANAQAAHDNGFETFPIFAAGVLSCTVAKVDPATVKKLAQAFVLLRAAFSACYVSQELFGPLRQLVAIARSLSWLASVSVACFLLALAGSASM